VKTSHRSLFVAVISLLLALNNGAFMALSLVGVEAPSSQAEAALTVDLDQWQNRPGAWQNGNLNQSNSAYEEGDVVPFRLAIEGLEPVVLHSIHINYDFTAGGHKAYDFLATYYATEAVLGQECAAGGGAVSSMCPLTTPPDTEPFCVADNFVAATNGKTVAGAQTFSGVSRLLTLYGGTIVSISCPVYSGPLTGNSTADITVTFTTTGSAALFLWGGHLAQDELHP